MEDPRLTALDLIRQDKNYLDELWLNYWANGGSVGSAEFEVYLHGLTQCDSFDLQILRWAIDDTTSLARDDGISRETVYQYLRPGTLP
ncbi:hypothetical protein [Arthrobacter sp. NPDC056727]|uniref:hypothetical protein n=1 Tax=Arthrobacter sp. NPDC056727 TaxID=3345927 RepID=UPI0036703624